MLDSNLKNEAIIQGAGLTVVLRPTFGCLIAIENKTNKSIIQIIEEINAGKGKLNDIVVVLREASKAADNALSEKQIERIIEEEGVMSLQMKMVGFFVKCLYGGKTQEKIAEKKIVEMPEVQTE